MTSEGADPVIIVILYCDKSLKNTEYSKEVHIAFVNFEKAFDWSDKRELLM